MTEKMTKAKLLAELRASRKEWDTLIAEVGEARLTEPGAAGAWSVRDISAHLTAYNRWCVNASEAHFRGEMPPMDGAEGLPYEEFNRLHHERTRDKPLAEVLDVSRRVYQRLLEMVEAHSEAFLTEPRQFPGAPGPILVSDLLNGDNYGHAHEHAAGIRAWLEQHG